MIDDGDLLAEKADVQEILKRIDHIEEKINQMMEILTQEKNTPQVIGEEEKFKIPGLDEIKKHFINRYSETMNKR